MKFNVITSKADLDQRIADIVESNANAGIKVTYESTRDQIAMNQYNNALAIIDFSGKLRGTIIKRRPHESRVALKQAIREIAVAFEMEYEVLTQILFNYWKKWPHKGKEYTRLNAAKNFSEMVSKSYLEVAWKADFPSVFVSFTIDAITKLLKGDFE